MDVFSFRQGTTPLLVSIPHCGVHVPAGIEAGLTPEARALPDTDWHVDRLYDFAAGLGASLLAATHSRYVIDLNRPPDNSPLYPGADNTELCPTTTFASAPIHRPGSAPDDAEIARRIEGYRRPYHDMLDAEIAGLSDRHGIVVLFEAHSIRSEAPRFFPGRLPDFNLGTGGGESADGSLAARLHDLCERAEGFSCVLNGRFTGGYITRHYGRPADHVHAVQLELAQATYMEEDPPYTYLPERAARVRPVLESLLSEMLAWAAE